MSNFLRKLLVFFIPLALFFIAINCYIDYNSAMFRNKANYLHKNKAEIETVFFGSSHTQDGINPVFMSKPASNMAYNTQENKINFLLFERYVNEMPKLKQVVFEFDYFTLEQPLDFIKHNEPLYRKFHNISGNPNWLYDFIAPVTDIHFYMNYIFESTRYKMNNNYYVNEAGYIEKDDKLVFNTMNYDSLVIEEGAPARLATRHVYEFINEIEPNTHLIDSIIRHCEKKNIDLIFLGLPKYHTYIDRKRPAKMARRQHYLDSVLVNTQVKYFDFEQDPRFRSVRLYNDDNHLNPDGAKKFTLIVDSITKTLHP